MNAPTFAPTPCQQENLGLAYLAYAGVLSTQDRTVSEQHLLNDVRDGIAKVKALCSPQGKPDWEVVWGPAVYTFPGTLFEDNAMFVARQISDPKNLTVAIRGTNPVALSNWIQEDFRTARKTPWTPPKESQAPKGMRISKATSIGLNVLLEHLRPAPGLPGAHMDIFGFLASCACNPCNISFTGHSLAGALAPALGLWFKERQGLANSWDPGQRSSLSITAFAGATPGNRAFSKYYERELGTVSERIYNELDIVPHAWAQKTLAQLPSLYAEAGIHPNLVERGLISLIRAMSHGYAQLPGAKPFRWQIQEHLPAYLLQGGVQHVLAYPIALGVPDVLAAIDLGWDEALNPHPAVADILQPMGWSDLKHDILAMFKSPQQAAETS